jgi:hypothetical protein
MAPMGATNLVHPDWDNKVRCVEAFPVRRWLKELDAIVWFEHDLVSAAYVAMSGRENAKQILVTIRASVRDPRDFDLFHAVVIPDTRPEVMMELKKMLDGYQAYDRLLSCRWPAEITVPPPDSVPPAVSDEPGTDADNFLIYCDGYSWRHHGRDVVRMADKMLKEYPGLRQIGLAQESALDKAEKVLVQKTVAKYKGRFKSIPTPPLDRLIYHIGRAKLLVLPIVKPGWGLFERWAMGCGTGILTWYSVADARAWEMLEAAKRIIDKELDLALGQERRLSMIIPDGPAPFEPAMMSSAILEWLAKNRNSPRAVPAPEDLATFNHYWRRLLSGNISLAVP